ncbi:MAG: site-specific integrase, partial [Tetragenococcus halophilus]|nr:site-specific integrase [Tetragenococcus halophilus]
GKRNADLTEFMLLTGVRFGEAVSLKEKDFDGNSITVNSTLDYVSHKTSEGHQTTTKTKNSQRVVELSDRAIEIMNEIIYENSLRALTEKYSDRKFIFTTKTGNPLHITNYNHSLKITAKNIGMDKTVTSHILRHTHVSMLAELRLPLKAIMDRVGHEDSKTTENIYTHVTKGMKKELINKLNEIVPYSCPKTKNKAKTEHSNIDK